MFDYPGLEIHEVGVYNHYQMARETQAWIQHELQQRLESLKEDTDKELEIYLTSRSYRKQPIFVIGYRNEGGTAIVEAWYFRMMKNPENVYTLQFALDRVPLEKAFGQSNAPPPEEEEAEEFLY